ncbi:transcription cofactor vestigial-like protein 4 [Heterodontus francisci]|uniref:transcription cofactor vestigial-like protein 4 n=1 Tax=Heterodontus francisci TaxID=7792 RepID=UPI00355C6EE6
MAVMNYQYIEEMNGFRVYILEGHQSLKSADRQQLGTNHRTGPPPSCPIKRKHPAEPSGISQSVKEHHPKTGRPLALLMLDKPVSGESLRGNGRGKGLGPAASSQPGHSYEPPAQARGPPSDQPLALIKKRPGLSRLTSNPTGPLPPSMLQQMRPSVITCTSSNSQQCGHSLTSAMHGHRGAVSVSYSSDTEATDPTVTCDSVVEEHFRRSLGKDYEPAASSVSVTGSVEDHFAKALGDKWLQIKAAADPCPEVTEMRGEEVPSPSTSPSVLS